MLQVASGLIRVAPGWVSRLGRQAANDLILFDNLNPYDLAQSLNCDEAKRRRRSTAAPGSNDGPTSNAAVVWGNASAPQAAAFFVGRRGNAPGGVSNDHRGRRD